MFEIPDDDEHFWEVCFYPKDFKNLQSVMKLLVLLLVLQVT